MKQFKICKGVTTSPLNKVQESVAANPNKYVFLGVFTQCSTPDKKIINRNGRIYQEKEVLRHLGYLREMIEEQGGILGELDHPEGRFDISMQNASHMITDLWYDDNTKCVMGKLKVLDTPNGVILRELIDAGYPLYVSSRAAGDVNEKTKEVEIAQIFTYDVVCTPGFKEAKLERVNESLSTKARKYLNESIGALKKNDSKNVVFISENEINTEMVSKYNNIEAKDVAAPLDEEDIPMLDPDKMLPVMNTNNSIKETEETDNSENSEKKDSEGGEEKKDNEDSKEGLTDEEKEENKKLILSIEGVVAEDTEDATEPESEKEEKKDDILDITAVEEEPKDKDDAEETNECSIADKDTDKIKKNAEDECASYESLLASIAKSEAVKESIIEMYPFAVSLSEANFAKFASLRPVLKKRCAEFIEENQIYDVAAINEMWMRPLQEAKKMQQNWLKLASKVDLDLYCAAPVNVQNAIEEQAKLVILETAEDVDKFWERMGLRQAAYKNVMNEQLVAKRANQQVSPLGYSFDIIAETENYF